MTIELLGVAGWTVENKQFYEKKLLMRAVPKFVHAGLGRKKALPRRAGNSLEWRVLNRPAASTTALTEGTAGAEIQTTWSSVAATINQYGSYVKVSEVALSQSIDDTLPEHVEMFGELMGDTIDLVARAILTAGTNVDEESYALAA